MTTFTQGVSRAQFLDDRMRVLAVERCLEIVGEAANRISDSFRDAHPHIRWQAMRGMRNLLAHEYGRIDHAILYRTVIDEIPSLLAAVDRILGGDRRR